jgi:hypothetical protein
LEALSADPPLGSDYLGKRVSQMISILSLKEDQSLANTLHVLEVDSEFLNQNFTSKAK